MRKADEDAFIHVFLLWAKIIKETKSLVNFKMDHTEFKEKRIIK